LRSSPTCGSGTDQPTAEFRYTDPEVAELLQQFDVDLVLDIGANRGQYAREIRRAGYEGHIISFEPLSDAHAALVMASRDDPRWSVGERCALGDHRGSATLHIAGNSESSSLLPMLDAHKAAAPASRYIGTETVPLRRLDEVAAEAVSGVSRPFVKLDVQGVENLVLQGSAGIMPSVVGLQVELDLLRLYDGAGLIEEMVPYLRQQGFGLFHLRQAFTDRRTGQILQVDGVFFRLTTVGGMRSTTLATPTD
jgi:FkbM family methyltransferase